MGKKVIIHNQISVMRGIEIFQAYKSALNNWAGKLKGSDPLH